MGIIADKTNDNTATSVNVGLDLMEILQYGQIALALGALVIIARELLF